MENQQTQTLETTAVPVPVTAETPVVPAGEGEGEKPDVAVSVDGVEVAVTDTQGGLELTPVTGVLGVLVLGLLAVVVTRLRKK